MRRCLACLALLGLAACADLVPPRSAESYYEYRQISGVDTLSFKWLPSQLPVRVWVADDSPLRPHLITAIDRWERAFLFGEFRATLVADSGTADIIVRNTPPVTLLTSQRVLGAFAPQCTGETTFELAANVRAIQLPWRIHVWPASNANATGIETCYAITVTHELGHALGIINANHTGAQPGDVMYRDPVLNGLSERDRATINRLYHGPTTLGARPATP